MSNYIYKSLLPALVNTLFKTGAMELYYFKTLNKKMFISKERKKNGKIFIYSTKYIVTSVSLN